MTSSHLKRCSLLSEIRCTGSAVLPLQKCYAEYFPDETIVLWCIQNDIAHYTNSYPKTAGKQETWDFITFELIPDENL